MSIRIAIADDHVLISDSLEKILSATGYIEVLGKYGTGEELLEGLTKAQPDVLLLDYHLPDQNGKQLARYITYHYPEIKIIVITGFDQPGLAGEMLESGCMGYLLKSAANSDTIIKAIEQANDGMVFIDGSVRNRYASFIRRDSTAVEQSVKPKLTHREIQILKEIANELSSQEIATKFSLSKRTVENHRNSIMIKSGAKNTVGLIKFAMELKLI